MTASKVLTILCMALLLGGAIVLSAHAATGSNAVGANEYNLFKHIFTGNLGKILGLGLTILGIWSFFVKGQQFGLALIAIGVVITMLPTFYNGMRVFVCPIVTSLGGTCGGDGTTVQ